MKIILLDNIKGIGRLGDVKNVSDGYGRNFLLPRQLAKIATEQTMKEADALKKKAEQMENIKVEKAKQLAESMKELKIEITRKANEKGTLFDGIKNLDIANALKDKIGYRIEEYMIKLAEPIKHIGSYTIDLELAPEVTTQVMLEVKSE